MRDLWDNVNPALGNTFEDMRPRQDFESDRAQRSASMDGDEPGSQSDETIELGQARSQNGHGCADLQDDHRNGRPRNEKDDPFEVSFDGDDDPMCPRSSE